MFGKAFAEFPASAEKAGLGGGFGDVEFLGDFGEGQAQGLVEEERFTEEVGDAIDLCVEDGGDFVAAEAFFGIFGFIAKFEAGLVFVGAGIVEVGEVSAAEMAEAHETLVNDDAGEPGGEAGVAFEAAEMEEGFGVGVLDFVFGVFVVAEDGAGEFDAGLVVPIHEIGEGDLVPLLRGTDEFGVDDGFVFGGLETWDCRDGQDSRDESA